MSSKVLVVGDVMTDVIVVPEGPIVKGSDRRATVRSRPDTETTCPRRQSPAGTAPHLALSRCNSSASSSESVAVSRFRNRRNPVRSSVVMTSPSPFVDASQCARVSDDHATPEAPR